MHNFKPLHPVMLGRPVQAFEQLAHQLGQQVIQHLQRDGHRGLELHILDAHFTPAPPHTQCPTGNAAEVVLHRATVLAYMQCRYGFACEDIDHISSTSNSTNATEVRIGQALQESIAQAVDDCLPATENSPSNCMTWQWQASIQVGAFAPQPLTVRLHASANGSLEAQLVSYRQARGNPNNARPKVAIPLPVQLIAQLVEQKITAADIQGLRPGSVLPINLGRATVLLNDEPMLSASVAEHQGKLHLTAFETLE